MAAYLDLPFPQALQETMPSPTTSRLIFAHGLLALVAASADASSPDAAFSTEVAYTADAWRNVSGGIASDGVYLDNLEIAVDIDAESLLGLDNTRFFLSGLYNNGETVSADKTGDLQGISNIEAGFEALRLYEAWVETQIGEEASIRFGLYGLDAEFDVLASAGLFLNGAQGTGTDIGQSGRNGPSIFPVTSLALRLYWQWDENWAVRAAVLDGVPGDPDEPGDTVVRLGDGDGALLVSELQWEDERRRLLLGGWAYTADFDEWPAPGAPDIIERSTANAGVYLRGETALGPADSGVTVFGRYGVAAGRYNVFGQFLGAGIEWRGPIEARPDHALGVAVAWAEASGDYQDAFAGSEDREIAIELTYRLPFGESFVLQPDIQYIINPGLDPTLDDALAVGLRIELTLW